MHILTNNIGISKTIGIIIFAVISYITFIKNIKFITKINNIIVPILIFFIILIGIKNFLYTDSIQIILKMEHSKDLFWLIEAIIYASYNLILLIPVLINLKNYLKSKKQILVISIITGITIQIISIFTFFLLVHINTNFSNLEMPIVYVIENNFKQFKNIYGIIIIIAIYTTAISVGISFLNNIGKNKRHFNKLALLLCITSIVISNVGFSNLVEFLFPLFGYLGMIQIYFIIKV